MALRNKPYLPLYVEDFMTDEKLAECSAEANGVYIRLMCLMHKSQEYGVILLKQKDKQKASTISNFATKVSRHMPYSVDVIENALTELVSENVLTVDGDRLIQKRMVKDEKLSNIKALAGSKGGEAKVKKEHSASLATDFAIAESLASAKAKTIANPDIDINNKSIGNRELKDDRALEVTGDGVQGKDPPENLELAQVMNDYMNKICANPSRGSIDELISYTKTLTGPAVLHAINKAADDNKLSWSYVKAILRGYASAKVQSLSDVQRLEVEHEAQKQAQARPPARPNRMQTAAEYVPPKADGGKSLSELQKRLKKEDADA